MRIKKRASINPVSLFKVKAAQKSKYSNGRMPALSQARDYTAGSLCNHSAEKLFCLLSSGLGV
jgi:hypothetical protein